jgi:hypothetical protein
VSNVEFDINLSVRIHSVLVISDVTLLLYFTILCACPFLMYKLYRCAITNKLAKFSAALLFNGVFSLNEVILSNRFESISESATKWDQSTQTVI